MALRNPFRRRDSNTRTAWGYTFQYDADMHILPAQMEPMKHSYDVLGEKTLERLHQISPSAKVMPPREPSATQEAQDCADSTAKAKPPSSREDMYLLLRQKAADDEVLGEFWTQVNTVPPWVDWAQIARGQDVFYRYGGPAVTGLAFQSLVGGMGGARVVETLARTGGFSVKVARHRMYETTQYILQCTQSLESIQPGGVGHVATIRVRLLHAAVRRRILALAKQKPTYYDVANFGIPINDLDSIGTISTFSSTLIWISLPRQGIFLRKQEIEDFIALWRYIAYLTGTPQEWFSTPENAKSIMESLLYYEISPTETSRILANNVIRSLEQQPPSFASRSMLEASSRLLNGDELCDALDLGRPGWYYWSLAVGQCLFFMAICYSHRAVPFLDRRKIAVSILFSAQLCLLCTPLQWLTP